MKRICILLWIFQDLHGYRVIGFCFLSCARFKYYRVVRVMQNSLYHCRMVLTLIKSRVYVLRTCPGRSDTRRSRLFGARRYISIVRFSVGF